MRKGEQTGGARLTAVAALLAASVLLSRLLGFLRESAIAYQLGLGPEVDAYRAAFQIPDLLNYFLAGGAFSVALIPLYQKVRAVHPQIGYTTVYRTMKLLCDAGLAHERNFDDGITRYEIEHEHHDHLVCTRCGKIIEFECRSIESTQDRIAMEHNFLVLRHRHELYGHCSECRDE